MNNEIKYDKLRVTVPNLSPQSDGKSQPKDEPLGILTLVEALAKAKELGGLDVILINENSDPPVAKIVDYSKFRYEKEKKAKELKKNSKASELKEVKMSYKIDVHDYGVRIKSASKFVKQGNRVKCTVQFKGREQQHDRLGYELLNRMAEDMVKICSMEGRPKREGRFLSCIMSPRPEVTKAVNDKKRADEKAKKKNRQARKQAEKLEKSGGEVEPVKAAGGAAGMESIDDDEEGDLGELDDLLGSTGNDDLF
jgi:translation initiation factor IF-3